MKLSSSLSLGVSLAAWLACAVVEAGEALDQAAARIAQTGSQFVPQLGARASYTRLSPVETSLGNLVGVPLAAAPSKISMPENNYALAASLIVPLFDYVFRIASRTPWVVTHPTREPSPEHESAA
ncbi:MAG TPA: hypothetical protein VF331_25045 [Polyangiales bacterium]